MNAAVPVKPGSPTWRSRDREWTWIAMTCVGLCGLFSLWPELDLRASRAFLADEQVFVGQQLTAVVGLYQVVPWIGRAGALLALLVALSPRRWWSPRWRRRLMALGLSMLVGVGMAVNGLLKEHWGRARPAEVHAPGGNARFSPALRPVAQCHSNCSFVSGHAATGFALMSIGLLGSPQTRRRWLLLGLVAGAAVGLGRMAQGGHFLSDVLFAGWVIWLCQAALREAWLRRTAWQRKHRRPRDRTTEIRLPSAPSAGASPGANSTAHHRPQWPAR